MRVLRVVAGVVVWLVASVLVVVSVLLCVSVLLLPVGLLLGFAALRLYGMGFRLLLPRRRDIDRGVRRAARRWWRGSPLSPKRGLRSRSGRGRRVARRPGGLSVRVGRSLQLPRNEKRSVGGSRLRRTD